MQNPDIKTPTRFQNPEYNITCRKDISVSSKNQLRRLQLNRMIIISQLLHQSTASTFGRAVSDIPTQYTHLFVTKARVPALGD